MRRLGALLIGLSLGLSTTVAQAQGAQIRAGFGMGVTSAGSRSGGLALSPSASYAARFGERFEVHASITPMITGIAYHNLGVVIQNVLAVGYYGESGYISGGPSLDVYDTMMCGTFCNRVAGITPGGQLSGAYYANTLGAFASVHLSWPVANPVYSGPPLWAISVGPELRFGGKR